MTESKRDSLRTLLRRVDEVRGLSERSESHVAVEPDDTAAILRTLGELVDELERSHRRLIETNVQLVSLREVAGRLASATDVGETARTVTRYLHRAFGFEQVCLLLVDRESGRLEGAWTLDRGGAEETLALDVPLIGERGALARAMWVNRTVLHQDCHRHPPALVDETNPLHEVFAGLGSMICVPLLRSPSAAPEAAGERCSGRCVIGDGSQIAPPPGAIAQDWAAAREERQRVCLACDSLPMLGVIGVARDTGTLPLHAGDVTLVESIGLSVAPMVENARLFQDLRRSERFRDHVLDSMASALVAVNMKGEVLTFNRAGEELLGYREDEVLGHTFGDLFGSEGDALVQATLEDGREAARIETLLRAKDGAAVPVRLTTSLLRNEKRAVYGAIATFLDLTPLKRAEENARQLDRLAALGRFTSSVAHEIRNPLTGIGSGVQYLARALADDAPQRENLEFILSEIRRLDRIVQDLFDVTHPRRLELRPQPLADTVRRAIQSLEGVITPRRLTVQLEVSPALPAVPHDADQMQQVFINLIKNAAEASDDGATIEVRLALAGAPGRGPGRATPAAIASVEDHGLGIDAEHAKTLFEPFFTTKPGGTGLGLYITHDIVKRHGGSLSVASEPGRGATFSVELPIEPHGGNR